tara:strand:+ start:433 stop:1299 length:867 start_codon:yes stop_codon:yes gene_type:complete
VWKTLSKVDVNAHIEKKGGLSYLSWAWAWGTLMEEYPEATYSFGTHLITTDDGNTRETDVMYYPDGTGNVICTITISDLTRTMWLPVMDFRNNAIQNPTSRQISDTKMRCLVKCMAMFGLGHYIYAGEDIPVDGGTSERDLADAGMPTDTAPHKKGLTEKHVEELVAKQKAKGLTEEVVVKPKAKKPTKAQQERTRMLRDMTENVTHNALNDTSRHAIQTFLTSVTDGTPKSEVEKWYDRMQTVISEYDAREKERIYLEEQEAKADSGAPKDLFAEAAGEITAETVGV